MKKLIQIDSDQNYINQFFSACSAYSDKIEYVGMKDDYVSVCHLPANYRASIDIVVVSLEMAGVDVATMVQQLRSAYQQAFIFGLVNPNNPYYANIENIATTYQINAVFQRTTHFQNTVEDIVKHVNRPTMQAYNQNPQSFAPPSIDDELFASKREQAPTATVVAQAEPTATAPAVVQQTIAISGSKGGVGKTTVSTEIASALAVARDKQYSTKLRVCIVDMDLDYGDVPTILNVKTGKNIFTWVEDINMKLRSQKADEIDYGYETIVEKFLKVESNGLHVLLPTPNPLQSAQVEEVHIRIIMKFLKKFFHYVILDLGNNTRDFTVLGLMEATDVILVADFEKTTIKSLKIMLDTLKAINFPTDNYNFILNKVESDVGLDEREVVETIQNKLGLRYIGSIPYLKLIKRLQNENTTMMTHCMTKNAQNEFSASIMRILGQITPLFQNVKSATKASTKPPETSSIGAVSFFKRLLGIR